MLYHRAVQYSIAQCSCSIFCRLRLHDLSRHVTFNPYLGFSFREKASLAHHLVIFFVLSAVRRSTWRIFSSSSVVGGPASSQPRASFAIWSARSLAGLGSSPFQRPPIQQAPEPDSTESRIQRVSGSFHDNPHCQLPACTPDREQGRSLHKLPGSLFQNKFRIHAAPFGEGSH